MSKKGTPQQRRNLAHLLAAWRNARRGDGYNMTIIHHTMQIEGGVDWRTQDAMEWTKMRVKNPALPPGRKEHTEY